MARANDDRMTGYIQDIFLPTNEFLEKVRNSCGPHSAAIMLNAVEAKIISLFLKANKCKNLLEIGTFCGYSAMYFAFEKPDLQITTLERDETRANLARKYIKDAALDSQIEVIIGDGKVLLPSLAPQSFDAIFIDANKSAYCDYLHEEIRLLKPGGLLVMMRQH
jgi:O-methyltransferase